MFGRLRKRGKAVIKLGIAGQADAFHAAAICSRVNGAREEMRRRWGKNAAAFGDLDSSLSHVCVHAVWDPNTRASRLLAETFGIAELCSSAEQLADACDAVCLCNTEGYLEHQKEAEVFLARGIPLYVDKPFAPTVARAREVLRCAREHRVPVVAGSARVWNFEFRAGVSSLAHTVGRVGGAYVFGNWPTSKGNMMFYGTHCIEIAFAALGPDVVSVENIGSPDKYFIVLRYRNGVIVPVEIVADGPVTSSLFVYGERGNACWYRIQPDFSELVRVIARAVENGVEPHSHEYLLHVVRVLNAAEESMANGGVRILVDPTEPI